MRLIRTELTNVCQHRHLVLDFSPGTNGIFGPNGAGKSNAFNMTKASLTGDFSVNPGKKDANIRHGLAAGEVSKIETTWQHGPTEFKLVRYLHTAGQQLTLTTGKEKVVYKRAAEIEAALTQLLGVSPTILDSYVFVEQERIYDFLAADSTTRRQAFLHLCRAERAEELWELLGEQLRADAPLVVDILDNSDELYRQQAELKRQQAALKKELQDWRAKLLTKTTGPQLERQQKAYQQRQQLTDEAQRVAARLTQAEASLAAQAPPVLQQQARFDQLQQQLADAEQLLGQLDERLQRRVAAEQLQQQRENLTRQLVVPPPTAPPAAPPDFLPASVLAERQGQAEAEFDHLSEELALFRAEGVVACPTCGTPLAEIRHHLEVKEVSHVELQQRLETYRQRAPVWQRWEQTQQAYERALLSHQTTIQHLTTQLAALAEPDPTALADPITAADVKRQGAIHQQLSREAQGVRRELDEGQRTRFRLEGEVDSLRRLQAELAQKLAALPAVTAAAAAQAEARLAAHREAKIRLEELDKRQVQYAAQQTRIRDELARLAELQERQQTARRWRDDLEFMRSIVHRNALPTRLLEAVLAKAVERTNERLEAFGNPFYVTLDEELSLVAVKRSGRREMARRLSGGQKVVLAIAFRLAVLDLFKSRIGMLALDEPTAGLDTDNMDFLTEVLGNLGAGAAGQQLILITHDRRLERIFDRTLELTASA